MLNIVSGLFSEGAPPVSPTSYESIETFTVGVGGTSAIDFTSIPSTFTHLQLRCLIRTDRPIGDGADLKVKFNGSSTNYAFHDLNGNGASATAAAGSSAVAISLQRLASDNTAGANIFAAMIIDILDYTSTSKNKTVRSLGGYDRNGGGQIALSSGLWYASPAAITSIELTTTATTSFKQYSSFALYGIKGA
jgi:hypothetical protein